MINIHFVDDRHVEIIVLADSTKFDAPSGNVVCGLDEIDIIITDNAISEHTRKMIEQAGLRILCAG